MNGMIERMTDLPGSGLTVWLVAIGEPVPVAGSAGKDRLHRTGCLAGFLRDHGHRVVWWTSTFDHFRKVHHFPKDTRLSHGPGLGIRLLKGRGYADNLSLARLLDHRQVASRFAALAPAESWKPDVILAALPSIELGLEAVRFGRRQGVPVVLDMRDMWPDIMVDAMPGWVRPLARAAALPMFRQAREACRGATAITGITEEFVDWGVARGGRSRTGLDRAFPLACAGEPPDIDMLRSAERFWDERGIRAEGPWRNLCFFGALGRQLDVSTILRAAERCAEEGLPWRFVLCGAGDRAGALERQAEGASNVVMPGWVDRAALWVLMRRSVAGLDPLPDRYDFLATINNKAVEYLSAGLPVIASPREGVLARLLEQEGCGLTYAHGDAEGLLRLLQGLDDVSLRRMAANAERVYEREFTAGKVYGGLMRHLERIVQSRGGACP